MCRLVHTYAHTAAGCFKIFISAEVIVFLMGILFLKPRMNWNQMLGNLFYRNCPVLWPVCSTYHALSRLFRCIRIAHHLNSFQLRPLIQHIADFHWRVIIRCWMEYTMHHTKWKYPPCESYPKNPCTCSKGNKVNPIPTQILNLHKFWLKVLTSLNLFRTNAPYAIIIVEPSTLPFQASAQTATLHETKTGSCSQRA